MDCLFDKRGDCMSIAFTISYSEYKELIDHAYKNRGTPISHYGRLLRHCRR